MSAEVFYLDEARRHRWLRQLAVARETGEVVIFNATRPDDAEVISLPRPEQVDGGS